MLGVAPHRLTYLCQQGVVDPAGHPVGRGHVRRFSHADVFDAAVGLGLQRAGFRVGAIGGSGTVSRWLAVQLGCDESELPHHLARETESQGATLLLEIRGNCTTLVRAFRDAFQPIGRSRTNGTDDGGAADPCWATVDLVALAKEVAP